MNIKLRLNCIIRTQFIQISDEAGALLWADSTLSASIIASESFEYSIMQISFQMYGFRPLVERSICSFVLMFGMSRMTFWKSSLNVFTSLSCFHFARQSRAIFFLLSVSKLETRACYSWIQVDISFPSSVSLYLIQHSWAVPCKKHTAMVIAWGSLTLHK